jgi:hypothetical protein
VAYFLDLAMASDTCLKVGTKCVTRRISELGNMWLTEQFSTINVQVAPMEEALAMPRSETLFLLLALNMTLGCLGFPAE